MAENEKTPLYSVIIPTYNRAHVLSEAIESVLHQSLRNYELIIVDDGSTDNTRNVLERYGSAALVLFQQNAGVSAARNAGIQRAKGTWLAFLDSDDKWNPDYLMRQAQHIRAHPAAVAHIVNAVTIHTDGRRDCHFQEHLLKRFGNRDYIVVERPLSTLIDHRHWYLQSTVIRRDILFASGLLNPQLTIAEDFDLIARVSFRGAFGFGREILVETYRRNEDLENLSSLRERDALGTYEIFETVYRSLAGSGQLRLAEKIALARASSSNWRARGNFFLRRGDRRGARECCKKAVLAWPSARSLLKYLASFIPGGASKFSIRK